jgi:hypothetical protein
MNHLVVYHRVKAVFVLILLTVLQVEAGTTSFLNTSGDGLWGTATNWSGGAVPSLTDNAVINSGRTATIFSNAPAVDMVTVGNNAVLDTTLNIGADLTAETLRVAYAADSIGLVQQTGGTLTVSSSFTIAAVSAEAGAGTYTISGGCLIFSNLTLLVGTQGPGLFVIEGPAPTQVSGGSLTLGDQGTLRFELDTLGITPLTLSGTLTSTGTVVVDGTDYEGFDGYFPLIYSTNLTSSATNVTFTGFGAREPAVVLQSDGLWLRVIAPPALSARLCSLVPASTAVTDYTNSVFSATRALESTGSAWASSYSEAVVMDTRLKQTVTDGRSDSWEITLGRGGQIASFRTTSLGETVPPQWQSTPDAAPWIDEVWQGVSIDTTLNNLYTNSPYFIHQAGVYPNQDSQTLKEPFYSPQVSASVNAAERRFTTINWGQHAHLKVYINDTTADDWQSALLYFTSVRDLGQGVIEVSLGFYNYGADTPSYFNMPWGGVRRTSMNNAFFSSTNSTGWTDRLTANFGDGASYKYANTLGTIAFSASTNGAGPSLGLVFGADSNPRLPYQTAASLMRYGFAGGTFKSAETTWRNYYVVSAIRRYTLSQGRGVWCRYYFALADNLDELTARIAARNLTAVPTLTAFDYSEATSPLIAYSVSGSGEDFRVTENSRTPQFFLYAHPVGGSFPVYEIIEKNRSRYLTWNPYATGVIKTYDGTLAGMRLLGFALSAAGTNYTYAPLSGLIPSTNYFASGETLFARTATPIETWRVEYFERTDNAGSAADLADPDNDGKNNLLEYAFGSLPTLGTDDVGAQDCFPRFGKTDGEYFQTLELLYNRRRDAAARGLTYELKAVSNLAAAAWSTNGITETGAGAVDTDFEIVTNRISIGNAGFVRLTVEVAE